MSDIPVDDPTPDDGVPVTPLTVADLDRHIGKMLELGTGMVDFEARLEKAQTVAFESQRLARRAKLVARRTIKAIVALSIIAVLLVVALVYAVIAIDDAADVAAENQVLIEQIEASRTEARKVSCKTHNDVLDAIDRKVTSAGAGAILALVPGANHPDDLDAERRARYDAYEAALLADDSLDDEYRDCTDEGIAAFYGDDLQPTNETESTQ